MGLLDLFSSSSTAKTTSTDNKIGASDQATATRVDSIASGANVNISSDNIAKAAIDSSNSSLLATEKFLGDQLTGIVNVISKTQQDASAVVSAMQSQTPQAITADTTNSTDDFMKSLIIIAAIGVGIYAFKSGAFR